MADLTDRDRRNIREGYRRIRDRLDRSEQADPDTGYHMLKTVRRDIANLMKTMKKAHEGKPCVAYERLPNSD